MRNSIVFALIVVLTLLGAAAVGRRYAGTKWRRDALSATMVVLAMLAAFLLFFSAGFLMHKLKGETSRQSGATTSPGPFHVVQGALEP